MAKTKKLMNLKPGPTVTNPAQAKKIAVTASRKPDLKGAKKGK